MKNLSNIAPLPCLVIYKNSTYKIIGYPILYLLKWHPLSPYAHNFQMIQESSSNTVGGNRFLKELYSKGVLKAGGPMSDIQHEKNPTHMI